MKNVRNWIGVGVLAGILSGCQCYSATEKLGDLVDATNDRAIHLDGLYHAHWDLTRIGHSDWCESKFNGLLCRRACCKESRPIVTGPEHRIVGEEVIWQEAVPLADPSMPPPLPAAEEY